MSFGALSVEGDRASRLPLREKYNESESRLSPDGRWMAYMSDESGAVKSMYASLLL